MFGRIAELSAGRRSKWVVIAVWTILALAMVPFYGDLQTEADDESDTFKVRGSDSQEAQRLLDEDFPYGPDSVAVMVYETVEGSIYARVQQIEEHLQAICSGEVVSGVRGVATPEAIACGDLGGDARPDSAPPTISAEEDPRAALISVATEDDSTPVVSENVAALRELVADTDGFTINVTGEAGIEADRSEALKGIDETLLAITVALILILLLVTYRSPLIAFVPLVVVILAYLVAVGVIWGLFSAGLTTVSGQSTAILIVLMFGAGTDYCLLIVSRYREELRRHEDPGEAMVEAAGRTGPAIMSAGGTVVAAMLVLGLADFNATREMGPILALGIALMMAAGVTLLPALLVAVGRRGFWPTIPAYGSEPRRSRVWPRVARIVRGRPATVAVAVTALLALGALGNLSDRGHLDFTEDFRVQPDSIDGHETIAQRFGPGRTAPVTVVTHRDRGTDILEALLRRDEVEDGYAHSSAGQDLVSYHVLLAGDPLSEQAADLIPELREVVDQTAEPYEAFVGGLSAETHDIREAVASDARLIVPLVLVAIFAIMAILLRSLIAPLYIVGTVLLSYAFALGASSLIFTHVFGQPDSDPSLALFALIFLVALGVDYNIFLLARVREEQRRLPLVEAVGAGIEHTGRVITSAGLILAGTFAALMALELVSLFQIGFVVALGLLVDTFLVRTLLVPAITVLLGERAWWPWGAVGSERGRGA